MYIVYVYVMVEQNIFLFGPKPTNVFLSLFRFLYLLKKCWDKNHFWREKNVKKNYTLCFLNDI